MVTDITDMHEDHTQAPMYVLRGDFIYILSGA